MSKLVSTCLKCGNPIYELENNNSTVAAITNYNVPYILRTCNCVFNSDASTINEIKYKLEKIEVLINKLDEILKNPQSIKDCGSIVIPYVLKD